MMAEVERVAACSYTLPKRKPNRLALVPQRTPTVTTAALTQLKKEHEEVDVLLKEVRVRYAAKMKELAARRAALNERKQRFDEYREAAADRIAQNKMVRATAIRRTAKEIEMINEHQSTITRLWWQITDIRARRARKEEILRKFLGLKAYVDQFIGDGKDFSSINHTNNRFKSLNFMRTDLHVNLERKEAAVRRERRMWVLTKGKRQIDIMSLCDKLRQAHRQLDRKQAAVTRLELKLKDICASASNTGLTIGHIRMIVHEMYNRILVIQGHSTTDADADDIDLDHQFNHVITFVTSSWGYLEEDAKAEAEKERPSIHFE